MVTLMLFPSNPNIWAHTNSTTRPSAAQTIGSGGAGNTKLKMPVDERLPVPPTRELTQANNELQAYFIKKYPRDTNLAEYKFYMSLFRHYVGNNGGRHHPVMRYAAMMAIVRLAPLQLDSNTTFETIAALAKKYRIHEYRMITQASQRMVRRGGMSISAAMMLANELVIYTRKAIKSLHFKSAERMARIGLTLAEAVRNDLDEKELIPMLASARLAAPLSGKFEQAEKRLAVHPNSPAANATAGLFLVCFTKHWMRGNRHLLLSGDPKLVFIAKADKGSLSGRSAIASATIPLANQWLDISKERVYRRFRQPIRKLAERAASAALKSVDRDILHALKKNQYDQAQSLFREAIDITTKLHITEFSSRISRWQSSSRRLAKLRDSYRKAVKDMNNGKSNGSDYLTIGEYLCFGTGRWRDGLPYLRRSKNGRIRQAATTDTRQPKSALAQKALGDIWWRIAEKYHSIERYNIRSRAIYWYDLAQKKLHGSALAAVIYRKLTLKHETF